MPGEHTYDYAIIRVVPRVERGELINVGVILSCPALGFPRGAHRAGRRASARARPVGGRRGDAGEPRDDPARLPRRGRRRTDRRAAAAQPLPLARVAAQHDHPDVAGAHRTDQRSGESAGAAARHDGAMRRMAGHAAIASRKETRTETRDARRQILQADRASTRGAARSATARPRRATRSALCLGASVVCLSGRCAGACLHQGRPEGLHYLRPCTTGRDPTVLHGHRCVSYGECDS